MSAQITFKGYTINYDEAASVVLLGGREVANFATTDETTAQVQAMRWVKNQEAAPVERDKGVVDAPKKAEPRKPPKGEAQP